MPTTSRLLFAVAVALGAAALTLTACAPGSPDDGSTEGADTDGEELTGNLPAGTALRATGNVNLRSGPSTSNSVITVITAGDVVTLQDGTPQNGFYQVSYKGTIGWTSGKYLEPSGGGASGPATTTLTTTADVNLRSGPSTTNSILAVIPLGTDVSVLAPDPVNGFYNVRYQGTDGWSSGKFLTATSAAAVTSFAGGKLWKFRATTLAVDIAVFVPKAAEGAPEVDVLFYSHGLNVCSPVAKSPPTSFVTDEPFALGNVVAASGRPVVLAVPFFDWEHLSANGMAFGGKHHKLGIPSNLNGVVAEVIAQVGKQSSAAPALRSLVLAGHSRAYDFLEPLAAAYADPQMSKGALAQLSEVWGLDTGYVCSTSSWSSWLSQKPSLEVTMVYRAGTQTASCGQAFASLAPSTGGRLSVHKAPEDHCSVPATEIPALLAALP